LTELVHNERTKLLATGLNNLGVTSIATGLLAPVVAHLYGTVPDVGPERAAALFLLWVSVGGLLMGFARDVLGGLRG
jgi:hypothetical protein